MRLLLPSVDRPNNRVIALNVCHATTLPSFETSSNDGSVVSCVSSEMLFNEEASALEPTNAPLLGSISSRMLKRGNVQSLSYWSAVQNELAVALSAHASAPSAAATAT